MIKIQSADIVSNSMSQAIGERLDAVKTKSTQELKSEKEIDKAASGFEALLLQQMFKAMWETVDTTGLMGEDSNASQIYRDMFNQAIADRVAEGQGIGVKDFLKRELSKVDGHHKGGGKAPKG